MSKLFTVTLQCMCEGRDEIEVEEELSASGLDIDDWNTDISESTDCLEGWENRYPRIWYDESPDKTCSELLEG